VDGVDETRDLVYRYDDEEQWSEVEEEEQDEKEGKVVERVMGHCTVSIILEQRPTIPTTLGSHKRLASRPINSVNIRRTIQNIMP
jgi:hypothetical protein